MNSDTPRLRLATTLAPFKMPGTHSLSHEDLAWQALRLPVIDFPPIELPVLSPDQTLRYPGMTGLSVEVEEPVVCDLLDEGLAEPIEIIDLLDPLKAGATHGTIYIKVTKEERVPGKREPVIKTEILTLSQRSAQRKDAPATDIFELLNPILIPPLSLHIF